jgi:uncharacterized SAM-binding protein YcdF (DUF218 family)
VPARQRNSTLFAELGPGGLSSLSLAFASALLTGGIPVAWRVREVLRAASLEERRTADAILVLGRELADDRPTAVFRARLDHGAELWRAGLAPVVVVSGGLTGTATRSEAEAGCDYLIERGLPADAVRAESSSRFTLENLFNVRETARREGWRGLLLVSDPLHLARASTLARGLSLDIACSPAVACPPGRGSLAWWTRAVHEGFLLHWYHVGVAYSRAIGSERLLGRVT